MRLVPDYFPYHLSHNPTLALIFKDTMCGRRIVANEKVFKEQGRLTSGPWGFGMGI